jgi:hypothetical protein
MERGRGHLREMERRGGRLRELALWDRELVISRRFGVPRPAPACGPLEAYGPVLSVHIRLTR